METAVENYLKKFFLQEADLAVIAEKGKIILPELDNVLDKFYEKVYEIPELKEVLYVSSHLDLIKNMKLNHWKLFWGAKINEEYVQARRQMGLMHVQIGMQLNAYFTAVNIFNGLFDELFMRLGLTDLTLYKAFHKLVSLDVSIVAETYSEEYNKMLNQTIEKQRNSILEMSTPIAQLWDSILFLPLVGILDSRRAQDVMNTMLDKITETESRVFVLDISGISVMDTAVANHLIKMTKATKLMGCYCILSGVSSSVAQTIVELGIHVDEVRTTNSMKGALQIAFKLIDKKKKILQKKKRA